MKSLVGFNNVNQNGNLTEAYLRGADGLISQTDYTGQSPATSYDLFNPHGDTSAITDQNGNLTGNYRYDSFGNVISGSPPEDGYSGKWQRETDNSTGLIQMGAREYDPALGRFVSADPLMGEPTDSQQLSRYPYVGNDPLSRYDLSGLYWGESYVDAAVGAGEDYLTGGTSALESDWLSGWNSMSTGQQVALAGAPAVGTVAAIGATEFGVGGAVLWGGEALAGDLSPEAEDLLGGSGPECEAGSDLLSRMSIPSDWVARVADNGKGIVYQEVGAEGNANSIRIMEPTAEYPMGYLRYYNNYGQPLDINGQPGDLASTYIPLDYNGPIPGLTR